MRDKIMLLLLVLALPALAQWQADQRLTNNSAESYTTNNNAWAVAAKRDTVHVVWFDKCDGNFEIYYKRSLNAGVSWSDSVRLTRNSAYSFFPAVAVCADTVHVVWQDRRDGYYQTYYKRSTDAGATWPESPGGDTRLSTNANKEALTPSLAVSGRDVWVVWSESVALGNYEIYYRHSTNSGTNWGSVGAVSSSTKRAGLPSVAISGSYVHFVWQDDRMGSDRSAIYYDRYNGSAWQGDTNLSTKGNNYSLGPCVAAAGANVFVTWQDNKKGGGKWYILSRRSTSNGDNGSWGSSDILFADENGTYTELPNLAALGTNFYAVWSNDSAASNNFEVRYNHSTDAGANWLSDMRLTNATGYSEYPSVAFGNNVAHVVWQDDRDGNYEIYYKRGWCPGWESRQASTNSFGVGAWLAYNSGDGKIYGPAGNGSNKFQAYNRADSSWAGLANYPWTPSEDACGCANGSGTVYGTQGSTNKAFKEYVTNSWAGKKNLTNNLQVGACAVYANDTMYVMTGYKNANNTCYLYAYNATHTGWIEKATPPDNSGWLDGSWMAYDNVNKYIYAYQGTSNKFYKLNVQTNTWSSTLTSMTGTAPGDGGCATYANGKIYALKGHATKEFWRYSIDGSSWDRMIDEARLAPADGASITTDGSYLYAEFAGGTTSFYRYKLPPSGQFNPAPIEENASALKVGEASFAIAPNPLASGFATIRYNLPKAGAAELSVYNVAGQAVLSRALSVGREASGVALDLRHLSNGVYVVRLASDGFTGTQKLVVQR